MHFVLTSGLDFVKLHENYINLNVQTYIFTSMGSISTKINDDVSSNCLSLMEITRMFGLLFCHLQTNQEIMVAMTACKKKGLILANLTTKSNLKQL